MEKVTIIGSNYANILNMARDLHQYGYHIEVLRVIKKNEGRLGFLNRITPEEKSRSISNYRKCFVEGDKSVVVKDLLSMAAIEGKSLLLPTDDYTLSIVDENLNELIEHYFIPNIDDTQGAICRLMDKNLQKEMAKRFNIPVVASNLITVEKPVRLNNATNIIYPCFAKPNTSISNSKSKMGRCDNEDELIKLLSGYATDTEALVEEFVEIEHEYAMLGVCVRGKSNVGGIFKTTVGGTRSRKGVAVAGETVSTEGFVEIIDACNKMIEEIGYQGIFDIDLIESKDGKIFFTELNYRPGASTHVLTAIDNNIAGKYADCIFEKSNNMYLKPIENKKVSFVNEKNLIEEYARGDISYGSAKKIMAESEVCFIKSDEDLSPYKYLKRIFIVVACMRLCYKIKDKINGK